MIQLRRKRGGSGAFLELAEQIRRVTDGAGGRLVVNDRADIARLARADGVHVGQQDLPVEAALALIGPEGFVGVSTHDRAQVDAALAGPAAYVAVGPIFETDTKDTGYTARGLDLVRYASGRGKPIVAIGGMTLERVPAVIGAGASAVAVITDLLVGDDPERRTRAFLASVAAKVFNV